MSADYKSKQHSLQCDLQSFLYQLAHEHRDREGFLILHECPPLIPETEHTLFVCLDPVSKYSLSDSEEHFTSASNQSTGKPFAQLEELVCELNARSELPALPIVSGFLAYECLHHLEDLPRQTKDPFHCPDYCFYLYAKIIELNLSTPTTITEHSIVVKPTLTPLWKAERTEELIQRAAKKVFSTHSTTKSFPDLQELSNFSHNEYLQRVQNIQDSIGEGDVYQVNLSQSFTLPFTSSTASLYAATIKNSFAAHGAFMVTENTAGTLTTFVSESPETFFYLNGSTVTTCPIKGTIPRSHGPDAVRELVESGKDNAELAMIVDLLRNDLGKIAIGGTVRVRAHARVQELEHVYHLVSDIEGEIPAGLTAVDVLKALFPCGSITGAPKVAAMKAIRELETQTRGVYTGCIGYFAPGSRAHFSVAIRTATILEDELHFQAGGGIVFPSDPESEYQETLAKAAGLYAAYCQVQTNDNRPHKQKPSKK